MFDHRVKNGQQLSHTCDQGKLWSFTSVAQPLVESSDRSITSAGDQGCHVEDCVYGGSAAPKSATASEGSAVTVERRYADQGSNLFAIELSEFWQLGDQGAADNRTDTGNTLE